MICTSYGVLSQEWLLEVAATAPALKFLVVLIFVIVINSLMH